MDSAAVSQCVLRAGVKLLERERFDLAFLSTTDYTQHKHGPGTRQANAFYAMVDRHLARLDELGVAIALTADHGMDAHGGSSDEEVPLVFNRAVRPPTEVPLRNFDVFHLALNHAHAAAHATASLLEAAP